MTRATADVEERLADRESSPPPGVQSPRPPNTMLQRQAGDLVVVGAQDVVSVGAHRCPHPLGSAIHLNRFYFARLREARLSFFNLPPDFDDRFQKGQHTGSIYGHGGSVNDPYYTLRLSQSASEAVPGGHLVNFARWKNPIYDKIVDEVYVTDMTNKAKLTELWRKAMEVWIPELPDIPLVHNFHRIPMNTTYWTIWPTEQNPYINGAFWHLTYAIVLWNLQPTQ